MIRILSIIVLCAVTVSCVEVISDKEAIERLHEEEAKIPMQEAEKIALTLTQSPIDKQSLNVALSDYKTMPIFKAHTSRLTQNGLLFDSSQVFTTPEYEDAVQIQASFGKAQYSEDSQHSDNDGNGNHEHGFGYYQPGVH